MPRLLMQRPIDENVFLDEGRGFSKKKNQDFQFLATLKFVEEHLLK